VILQLFLYKQRINECEKKNVKQTPPTIDNYSRFHIFETHRRHQFALRKSIVSIDLSWEITQRVTPAQQLTFILFHRIKL